MAEPDSLVLTILREMRSEIKAEFADVRSEIADVRSEVKSLRADVASDMMALDKKFSERFAGLQRAVMEYHSSTIGHGVLINELDERLRRVEQHLNLPPVEAH